MRSGVITGDNREGMVAGGRQDVDDILYSSVRVEINHTGTHNVRCLHTVNDTTYMVDVHILCYIPSKREGFEAIIEEEEEDNHCQWYNINVRCSYIVLYSLYKRGLGGHNWGRGGGWPTEAAPEAYIVLTPVYFVRR